MSPRKLHHTCQPRSGFQGGSFDIEDRCHDYVPCCRDGAGHRQTDLKNKKGQREQNLMSQEGYDIENDARITSMHASPEWPEFTVGEGSDTHTPSGLNGGTILVGPRVDKDEGASTIIFKMKK